MRLCATVTTGQTDHNLRTSTSGTAHLGWKQDSNDHFSGAMDDVWVIGGSLTSQQVYDVAYGEIPPEPMNLSLQVDPTTGAVLLTNPTLSPITFNSYRITSSANALNPAGWNPISNGNDRPAQFPIGDGSGNGWEASPNPNNGELIEWFLTGDSTLNSGESIFLGTLFNPVGSHDLVFRYGLATNTIGLGVVQYLPVVPPPATTGDYNSNGDVDAADYVVWRKSVGQTGAGLAADGNLNNQIDAGDYEVWRSHFGQSAGSGSGARANAAVPESATSMLLMFAAAGWYLRRHRAA